MRKTLLKKRGINTLLCKIAVTVCLLFPAIDVLSFGTLSAKPVSGKVVSATDKEALIGASIEVQGRKFTTVTNIDGDFTIDAEEGETLLVSYIGFVSQKVKVKGDILNISLQEDSHSLADARPDTRSQHHF